MSGRAAPGHRSLHSLPVRCQRDPQPPGCPPARLSARRYALLKSNQVDEASMTDLSRLVFKIIPYDKSEVIQMMYKLLYLESQLENGGQ